MWQEVAVYVLLALGMGFTLLGFYRKLTGKSSCCGGGCTCKGSCGSGHSEGPGDGVHGTTRLRLLTGRDSCCPR